MSFSLALILVVLAATPTPSSPQGPPAIAFTKTALQLTFEPLGVVATPLDSGDVPDLAVLSLQGPTPGSTDARLFVFEGFGDGRFGHAWSRKLGKAFPTHALRAFDVNLDGWMDLSIPGIYEEGQLWFGDGSFAFEENIHVQNFGGQKGDITFPDFSGDGLPDSLTNIADFGDFYLDTGVNLGHVTFGNASSVTLPKKWWSHPHMIHADLDGDGNEGDIVITSDEGMLVFSYPDEPTPLQSYQEFDGVLGEAVAVDLDGDGDLDLAATRPRNDGVTVFENTGGGIFAQTERIPTGRAPVHLVAADLDGDGHVDLAVANGSDASLTVLRNDGAGNLYPEPAILVGHGPDDIEAADLDLDGDVDLAVALLGDRSIAILLNEQVP